MEFVFDMKKNREEIKELENFIDANMDKPGVLMPVMQEVQNKFSYLPKEMLNLVSERLNIPLAEIYGVATFYSQFTFIPMGENKISVCLGTACYVKGAQGILEEIQKNLGLENGINTTQDLKFSIIEARCLGDCSLAPVFTINEDVYPNVTKKDIKKILRKY